MAIDMRSFASGDTDYIAKLNQNFDAIQAAIDLLQLQASSSNTPAATVGLFFDALFNSTDVLIGTESYVPEQSGSNLTVSPGGMYLTASQSIVASLLNTIINFSGQTSNTYYVVVDSAGLPARSSTAVAGTAWSVVWNGSAFVGDPVRVAPCFYDANEATASRISTALGDPGDPLASPPIDAEAEDFETLDERLEAGEAIAVEALENANSALALASVVKVRKVGVTVTEVGVAGAIQVDFYGTIVGWSCIADDVGDLEVEVSIASSSAPPADPTIPDVVTDKISASASIELSTAQSASSAAAGVSSWDTSVDEWDVIQFNVVTLTTLTRATLYLRIEEVTSP